MSFPNKDKSMSFNADDNCEFDPIPEQENKELENSFSDLSSISNESIKEVLREENLGNIEFSNPESESPKKERKKRTKEELNKTPLYIFDCIFCAREKIAFKILSSNKLSENYNLCVSNQDYQEINDLVNYKNINIPNKKLRYYNSFINNLELLRNVYPKIQSEVIIKQKVEEQISNEYRPALKNIELFSRICVKKNIINKENLIIFQKKSSKTDKNKSQNIDITDIKFVGFETDFINKDNEFFEKNLPHNESNHSVISSKMISRIENKRLRLKDISFETQVHDIYNPRYSSDESKENINLSINISNYSSNVFNNTRHNNLLNNNLKTGVSNSEILSPENISIINKSDNQQELNYNKNSQSYVCYSHINKFSLPNSVFSNNNSEFKSNNDSKNNSHIVINDKKFIIDDNSLSRTSSKFFSLLPPKTSKLSETNRRSDKSKPIIEEKYTYDSLEKERTKTPKKIKNSIRVKKQQNNIIFSSIDNFSFKKKAFPTSLYASNKKSDVQARLNMNNLETNNPVLLCSYEKKPKEKLYKKVESDKCHKFNNNVKKLEFNNTVKGFDNSFSINKYTSKPSTINTSLKKSSTKQDINSNQSVRFDSTLSMSSPKYKNSNNHKMEEIIKIYSGGQDSSLIYLKIENANKNSTTKVMPLKKFEFGIKSLRNDFSKKYF